jgi:hypothetical protein
MVLINRVDVDITRTSSAGERRDVMHSLLSATIMADFGMALPYFIEIVELKNTTILYGPRVAHSMIGQVFGEQAIIMTGIAPDGQTWRAIYPHETSDCWAMPLPIPPTQAH